MLGSELNDFIKPPLLQVVPLYLSLNDTSIALLPSLAAVTTDPLQPAISTFVLVLVKQTLMLEHTDLPS